MEQNKPKRPRILIVYAVFQYFPTGKAVELLGRFELRLNIIKQYKSYNISFFMFPGSRRMYDIEMRITHC